MHALDFSPELLDYIFAWNDDDSASLTACARVCKQWRGPAQYLLFQRVALSNPASFPGLFQALQTQPSLTSGLKYVKISAKSHRSIWLHEPESANLAASILDLLPSISSLELKGPRPGQGKPDHPHRLERVVWRSIAPRLRESVSRALRSPDLTSLHINGWIFNIWAQQFHNLVFSTSSLKRLALLACFQGIGTPSMSNNTSTTLSEMQKRALSERLSEIPEEARGVDLDELEVLLDMSQRPDLDHSEIMPESVVEARSEFVFPPGCISSTRGMKLIVHLDHEYYAYPQLREQLQTEIAPTVRELTLMNPLWSESVFLFFYFYYVLGIMALKLIREYVDLDRFSPSTSDDDPEPIYDLTHHTSLQHLTIHYPYSPQTTHLPALLHTLPINHRNTLQTLTILAHVHLGLGMIPGQFSEGYKEGWKRLAGTLAGGRFTAFREVRVVWVSDKPPQVGFEPVEVAWFGEVGVRASVEVRAPGGWVCKWNGVNGAGSLSSGSLI
ncbi:hypothetical protein CC1G_02347 [Coprinopsis cinerea okayama7|uniref:F-box domain-containing protein n=1 Tax=Coprinopsis cinerea (strain Okayama-7 / 130 / ATCC MYA-4618 / FGSC 9003) TaxID=240176 RepID=A8N7U0_COPC7|nr:hypothetical protein CC1G_02347 [Coprinopsis cinerea okayama7\|eukprot:XP_001830896.2 hypothetical protein CC1G_02347 [Coprinopsis cinerea okayama7\